MTQMAMKKKAGLWFLLLFLGLLLAGMGCGPSGTSPSMAEEKSKKESKKDKKVFLPPEAMEHLSKGQKLWIDQKSDEALKEFQETVRLAPDSPVAHFWLGKVHFFREEKEQAEKAFKKVLELDPKNYQAKTGLGRLYSFDKDKLEQAEKLLKEALEESPDNLEARFSLGMNHLMQGEQKKASGEFAFVFAKEGEFAVYHFEMGRALEALGDKKTALHHYQRALVINPKLAGADQAFKRLSAEIAKEAKAKAEPAPGAKPKKTGKKQL
jgi:tetratricopeptide (TPR) repeat protein